jgi:uncharacterized damage-inducible protein DinB
MVNFMYGLTEEQQHAEVPSSFSSLYKTIFHVWTAETAWWQRMHGGQTMIKEDPFHGSFRQVAGALLAKDQDWLNWIKSTQEDYFTAIIEYKNLKGEIFHEYLFHILLHLFNHGTYHNGQLVTMFHHLGLEKIPATDFIVWSRENKLG